MFLRGGEPYVEDLGSTNGTFVDGKRLDESAVALHDGDLLGFGSDHFVYRVKLHRALEVEPTLTQMMPPRMQPAAAVEPPVDMDKTTFIGAAHSFLDIFYVDRAVQREDEVNEAAQAPRNHAVDDTQTRRPRHRWTALAVELTRSLSGGDRTMLRRLGWGALAGRDRDWRHWRLRYTCEARRSVS